MQGFVVKDNNEEDGYTGINSSYFMCNAWPYLSEWNQENKEQVIDLNFEDNIIYKQNNLYRILNYFQWIVSVKRENVYLFFLSTQEEISLLKGKEDRFIFLGYDCVYLENDYRESILFSTIANEIKRGPNYSIFELYIKQLNQNGLFNIRSSAESYLNLRKEKIDLYEGNFERAWEKSGASVVKVYIYR